MLSLATAVVGGAGALGAGADDGGPKGKPPKLSFDSRLEVRADKSHKRQRYERKRRNSRAARKVRRRSKTAYTGHGRAAAIRLARDRFPEHVDQPTFKPLVVRPGERVLEYESAFSALVRVGDGRGGTNTALAESTFPLRSKLGTGEAAPVSLDLAEDGDRYEPRNPSVALRIAKDPAAGVRVGGVRVTAAPSSDPVSLSGNTAFFANAGGSDRDLDLMVAPDPLGAEFAWQIRSARSPETLALRFKLPEGASLEIDESLPVQRANITRDGKDIATVSPASAYDADGYPVATSYSVHGSTLELKVDHRGRDLAYPILVDPAVEHYLTDANGEPLDDCTGGFLAPPPRWTPSATAGQGWQGAETCEGLWLWKLWPGNYGEAASWLLYPPSPHAFFTRVQYYASHDNDGGYNCIIEGAWDGWYESGQWFHPAPFKPSTPPYVTHEPWFGTDGTDEGDPANYRGDSCTNHHFNFKDHFFSTPNPNNILVFGYWSGGGTDGGGTPYVLLRGTTNFLDDNDSPQLSAPGLPSGWVRRATPSVNASATESGLGVHHIDLTLPHTGGAKTQTHNRGCEGGTKYPCQPPDWSTTFAYDTDDVDPDSSGNQPVPEGISTARLRAYDAAGKPSNDVNWPLKVDRSPPAISVTGSIVDASTITDVPHVLDVDVSDGSGTGSTAQSGVQSVVVDLDERTIHTETPDCTNVPDNCKPEPFRVEFDGADMAHGEHEVLVTATDRVGNSDVRKVVFTVKHATTAAVGPGEVNLLNGVFTTSAEDVSIPGFNSSLALNRTYSSRDPADNIDPMFGKGWLSSLPVSEAAAEYAGIVESPKQTSADLSFSDGLRIAFKATGAGAYSSPAGFKHLKLTKSTATNNFRLVDSDGNAVTFARPRGSARYVPTQVDQPGPATAAADPLDSRVAFWRLDEPGPGPELVPNTGFESNAAGWSLGNGGFWNPATSLTRNSDGGHSGSAYGRVVTPGSNSYEGPAIAVPGPFKKNVRYTVSVWVRGVAGSGTVGPTLGATGGDNGGIGTAITATSGWTKVTSSWKPAANYDSGYVSVSTRAASQAMTFDFDDASVQETGTSAHDSSNSDRVGTYVGGYTLDQEGASADGDEAVLLDGATGRITTAYNPFTTGSARTFEGWAKRRTNGGNDALFAGDSTSGYPVLRALAGNDVRFNPDTSGAGQDFANALPGTGGWFHWALAWEGATRRATLYINGVSKGTLTFGHGFGGSPGNLELGAEGGTASAFDGYLDEVAVYSRALSADEVAQRSGTGGANSTSIKYEVADNGVARPKQMLAPAPSGVNCTGAALVPGCRALSFVYATSTTASGSGSGQWGDYKDQVKEVNLTVFDPATTQMRTTAVARYLYDQGGYLRAAWDPRISPALTTTYGYDSAGHLTSVTPPGQEAWTLAYATTSNDPSNTGRLSAGSRPALPGTATTKIAYGVPLTGSGAPYQMGSSNVAAWGQSQVPTAATAIFPPNHVPSDPPSSYAPADVHYLDNQGRRVNLAEPGGRISTSEYEPNDNVVRELTPANRERALASGNPAQRAAELETQRTFAADGTEMTDEVGPLHTVELASGETVQARRHLRVTYDEGRPGSGAQAQHLPTTTTTSAQIAGRADADARTTKQTYNWTLGKPVTETKDPGGLNLTETTLYDSTTGLVTETRQPSEPGGGGAGTTKTIYWSAGANAADAACGGRPAWANLLCKTTPAAQPGGSLPPIPVKQYTYNWLGQVATQTDTSGTTTRTHTFTYDDAGRELSEAISSGAGVSQPTVFTAYHPTLGLPTTTSTSDGTITRAYDTLGRLVSYGDANDNTSTTTYDLLSRPSTTTDGKGSQTRTYDASTGDLTAMSISGVGSLSASYDADGKLTRESYPNGVRADTTYDETGDAVRLTYTKSSDCGTSCTWYSDRVTASIHDQWLTETSTLGDKDYAYDAVGRLKQVRDTPSGGLGCTVRDYSYDANSNRTARVRHDPAVGGACDPTSSGTTSSYHYDTADRLDAAGYTYDAFGRTLKVPGRDTGAAAGVGDMTQTYFADDRIESITQNAITARYTLDPNRRVRTESLAGVQPTNRTNHYADDSDSPTWSSEDSLNVHWSRNVAGIDGDLVAIQDSVTGVQFQLSNLHGDLVAVAAADSSAPDLLKTSQYDEFGVPAAGNTADRYGWLGSKRRATSQPSGAMLMGQRVYLPTTGRFLQTDPVPGGSSNAYDYAGCDPVNADDLDGRLARCRRHMVFTVRLSAGNTGSVLARFKVNRLRAGRGFVQYQLHFRLAPSFQSLAYYTYVIGRGVHPGEKHRSVLNEDINSRLFPPFNDPWYAHIKVRARPGTVLSGFAQTKVEPIPSGPRDVTTGGHSYFRCRT